MEHNSFAWIYLLIFMIIPLARIIPRLLKRGKMKNLIKSQTFHDDQFEEQHPNVLHVNQKPIVSSENEAVRELAKGFMLSMPEILATREEFTDAARVHDLAEEAVQDVKRHVERLRDSAGIPLNSACDVCRTNQE